MKTVDEGAGQEAQAAFADDVGGVEARGSGEGICLRRSMHDQYARRAALDSSPDDEQHELFTCGRTLRQRSHPVGYFEDKTAAGGPRVLGRHALTNGQSGAARGGKASAGTEDTSCARSWVGSAAQTFCHVTRRGENQGPCGEKRFDHEIPSNLV